MNCSQIIFQKDGPVATITLNRPEKLNAYSETMVHEILAALGDAALGTQVTNYCEDVKEGIAAFHEKRPPRFQGK